MTRFVHSADWQLEMTRHLLSVDAQARFTAARIDAITAIGLLAEAAGCSFVVISGDVFGSNQLARQVLVRSLDAMKATPMSSSTSSLAVTARSTPRRFSGRKPSWRTVPPMSSPSMAAPKSPSLRASPS
ncbi:MAG: hypothetical protein EXQ71_08100 [Acidimicrobiia bacterium]|nr:hypothetical protein [Acidimicrobiia bacterium]